MLLAHGKLAGESGGKAMSRIYGNIGFRGLWNGLPVRIAMVSEADSILGGTTAYGATCRSVH